MDYPVLAAFVLGSLALGLLVIAPLAMRSRRANQQPRLVKLATELGLEEPPRQIDLPGTKGKVWAIPVEVAGIKAEICIRPSGNADLLSVVLPGPALPRLVARHETALDRFGKRLRINRELQTGDPEFDAKVYLESSESARVLHRLLGEGEVRRALSSLLQAGYFSVTLGPDGLALTGRRLQKPDELKAPVASALELLAPLRAALPAFDSAELNPERRARGDRLMGFVVLFFVAGVCGRYLLPTGLVDYGSPALHTTQDRVHGYVGIGWLIAIPLVWAYVRGHSRSLRNLLVIVLMSFYPLLVLVPEAFFAANALLDGGPAVHAVVGVQGKKTHHRGPTEGASLQVSCWLHPADPKDVIGLDVSRDTFERFSAGDAVQLTLRPGAFGWQWIQKLEKATPAAPRAPAPPIASPERTEVSP
ncbi:MAG TPA: hypothetical protein VGK67_25715 [Myxococcales bacterium]